MKRITIAIVLTASATRQAAAAELRSDTLSAWNAYERQADLRMQDRAAGRLFSFGLTSRPTPLLAYGGATS